MKSVFSTITFAILLTSGLCAQDLAQWRGPNRDGIYPESGLLKSWPADGPKLLWHFDGLGDGHASAAIYGDHVYTAGIIEGIGYIFCLGMDGKLIWKIPYGEEWTDSYPGVRSTPMIYKGRIYLLSGYGKLVCRKADNGDLVWTVDVLKDYEAPNIKWGITENLAFDGEKLFCTSGGPLHNVIALNMNTGKLIWSCKGNGEISAYCSPAIVKLKGRTLVVTQTANSILGIDAATGNMLWSHDQPNKYSVHANTPIYHDGHIYCQSGYGKGGVLLKLNGDGSGVTEVWRSTSIDNRMGGSVRIGGKIYGSDDSNKSWHVVDWATGVTMFSEKITGRGTTISSDGMLYLYGDNGEIVLAQPEANSFKKVSSFKVPYGENQHWAHPVISHGKLFVRHGSSMMVYDLKK